MKRLLVENNPNLVRDVNTNSIINTDTKAYAEYVKKKRIEDEKQRQIQSTESRINRLEDDVKYLKSGIDQILELLKK